MPGFMLRLREEGLHQRRQDGDDLVGLGAASGSAAARRRITRVGGDAEQQAGLGGAARGARRRGGRARCRASGPGRGSRPRRATPASSRSSAGLQVRADAWRRSPAGLSSSMMRSVSTPARMASGLPPKVVPWLPGPKMSAAFGPATTRADRHARAQALGQRHHVGLDAGPLVREPLAGAAHAALHLVDHQQPVALVAERAHLAAGSRCASG